VVVEPGMMASTYRRGEHKCSFVPLPSKYWMCRSEAFVRRKSLSNSTQERAHAKIESEFIIQHKARGHMRSIDSPKPFKGDAFSGSCSLTLVGECPQASEPLSASPRPFSAF
jgi:hypothetical protein